jgi:hypothetical protein
VIRSRNIKPSKIAGNCRIFDEEAVGRIEQELRRIAAAKEQRNPTPALEDA